MNGEWWSALPPLPLPHEMQQWDKQAVELGILPEILMENAAAAAFPAERPVPPACGEAGLAAHGQRQQWRRCRRPCPVSA